jgi:hypothetical protein
MIRGKRTRFACLAAALALIAAPALAGQSDSEGVELASYRTARRGVLTTPPRRVAVWQGSPKLASANYQDDDGAEMPPMPRSSRSSGEVSWTLNEADAQPMLEEPSAGGGGCDGGCDGSCGGTCDSCSDGCGAFCGDICGDICCDDPCLPPWWSHRSYIFGTYLFLQPTGIDIAHAIQQNGVGGAGTTPDGRVGVVDQAFTSAYSVGFGVALSPCASIDVSYIDFFSHNTDSLSPPQVLGGTVASLVLHPESEHEGSTNSIVNAQNDIDFKLVDIMYRRLLKAGPRFALNYAVGGRWARLDQGFDQIGEFASPTGTVDTFTDINFTGGGLRFGLDGMQRLGCTGFGVYGKGFLSLAFGQFESRYQEYNVTTESVLAQSSWQDQRVVPIIDYEVGVNWTSCNGHWRFSAGYYTAFWFNVISTPEYIQAVQTADFVDLGETVAFDGLVSRLEFRF